MKNKKRLLIIITIFATCLIIYLFYKNENKSPYQYFIKQSEKQVEDNSKIYSIIDKLNKDEKDKLVSEIYSVRNIPEKEKKKIAISLFDEYINNMRTNWYYVKNNGGTVVLTFTDYKITEAKFEKQEGNRFTFSMTYDIKCTDESNYWRAGNGKDGEDNWIIGKFQYIDIVKYKDKYYIDNIYTG
ncbi:hypothetical protein NPD7_2644 [Clostridium sporogenes]|uniref:hypothetical protein n=1 Tax=Clostridium TaxID=1485 RepID=UPI000909485B|nr:MULTISPECIES: hypothetical protein [Clostridium]APF26250.1 hypothetical protein NPD7_2644 [Clostridium sporogenes]MDI6918686.1 hypothetical protein [Clostridium botulinum]WMU98147.1 hypothetical protein QA656_02455 [Clostridium botulinum]